MYRYLITTLGRPAGDGAPFEMLRNAICGMHHDPADVRAYRAKRRDLFAWMDEQSIAYHFTLETILPQKREGYDEFAALLVVYDDDAAFQIRLKRGSLPLSDDLDFSNVVQPLSPMRGWL